MSERNVILLVEDDPAVLSSVKRRLGFEGYNVEIATNGREAVEKAQSIQPELILLDLMIPEISGFEVIEKVRNSSSVPILIITAKDSTSDIVSGFERGADDYVIKPFVIEELLARIRALLRRFRLSESSDILNFLDIVLDSANREVKRGNTSIVLTPREFAILEYFLRHPKQVLTRQQIFEAVWCSEHMGDSNIIDVNIRALREKLESNSQPRVIQTVWGIGYSLREN